MNTNPSSTNPGVPRRLHPGPSGDAASSGAPAALGAPKTHDRPWHRRNPVAVFMAALVLALASSPFTEAFAIGDLVEAVRLSVLLLSGLLALGGRRRTLAWGIVLVAPALAGKWLNHLRPDLVPAWAFLAPGILFLMLVVFCLLRFILLAPRVDSEVLCAGVATYLILGLLWAFGYILVDRLTPGAFTFSTGPLTAHTMKGFTAIYFSFITLCTVGYGDIVPVSGAARMLAMMEATLGLFYTTLLVARLVSLYTGSASGSEPRSPAGPEFR